MQFPHGAVISVNQKDWMNIETMIKWIDKVWRKQKGAFPLL